MVVYVKDCIDHIVCSGCNFMYLSSQRGSLALKFKILWDDGTFDSGENNQITIPKENLINEIKKLI